jgi:hypothetical protein
MSYDYFNDCSQKETCDAVTIYMMSNAIAVPGDAVEVTCGRLQGCCFLLVHLSHFYVRLQNDAGFLFVAAPGTVQKMTPVPIVTWLIFKPSGLGICDQERK